MNRWYYTLDNKQRLGPVASAELRRLALSGAIRPGHMVLREGGGKWVAAAAVKGLFAETAAAGLAGGPRSDDVRPAPAAQLPQGETGERPAAAVAHAKRRWRGPIISLVACLAFVLLLCSGLGLLGVMFGWGPKDRGDSHDAPAAAKDSAGNTTDKQAGQSQEKPPGGPADKEDGSLWQMIVRMKAELDEMNANPSGNQRTQQRLLAKYEADMKALVGKPVVGTGTVLGVFDERVALQLKEDEKRKWRVYATARDKNDPLLDELVRGDVVEFQGVLQVPNLYSGDPGGIVTGCTFTRKK
jgi:hypothetical protein